jgi:outer membrane protein OmpA-like peptidoglycan-associated protein
VNPFALPSEPPDLLPLPAAPPLITDPFAIAGQPSPSASLEPEPLITSPSSTDPQPFTPWAFPAPLIGATAPEEETEDEEFAPGPTFAEVAEAAITAGDWADAESLLAGAVEHAGAPRLNGNGGERWTAASVFDGLAGYAGPAVLERLERHFETVIAPGEKMQDRVQPGDILLERALGQGSLASAELLFPHKPASLPRRRRLGHNRMIIRARIRFGESDEAAITDDLLAPPAIRGSREHTLWVQRALNALFNLGLPEDGLFGVRTRGAVREFQQGRGLAADGVVGSRTEAALVGALSEAQGKPAAASCSEIAFPEILNAFGHDEARVLPRHQLQLIKIAACIVGRHGTAGAISAVRIAGHTDTSGDETYNEGLALQRAEAVKAALKDRLRDRAPHLKLHQDSVLPMTTESRGESEARFPTDAENRRVEIFIPELKPPPPKKKKKKKPKPKPDLLVPTVERSLRVLASESFPLEQKKRLSCLMAAALNPAVDDDLYINGKDFIVRQLAQGTSRRMSPKDFVTFVAKERVRRDLRNPLFAPPNESDAFVKGSLQALDERILAGINLIADQTQRNSELNVNSPILRQMNEFVSAEQRNPKSIYFCYGVGQK